MKHLIFCFSWGLCDFCAAFCLQYVCYEHIFTEEEPGPAYSWNNLLIFLSWKTTSTITVAVPSTEITKPNPENWAGAWSVQPSLVSIPWNTSHCSASRSVALSPTSGFSGQPAGGAARAIVCTALGSKHSFSFLIYLFSLLLVCLLLQGVSSHICTSQCLALLYKVFFVNQEK